jgi:apolipoprotein N-acyltransferase
MSLSAPGLGAAPTPLPQRVAKWCLETGARSSKLAAFSAGAVSVLAMAPFFLWPVLFLTFPVLAWLMDRASAQPVPSRWRQLLSASMPGWWFGFGYFVFGLFWVGEAFLVESERFLWALPFAVTLLPGGLALFFGAATAVACLVARPGLERVLALAITLSAAEWLRGHIFTGFPWNTIGYALTMPLALMQSSGLIGIYGLTLVAVLIFAAPGVLLAQGRARLALAIAVVPLATMAAYGTIRLATLDDAVVPGVRLRIVQPSIPQREKWRPENQRQIFFDHIQLSKQLPDGTIDDMASVTHVIWPEAAMPFRPLQSPEALAAIGEMLPAGKFLISGGLRTVEPVPGEIEARNSLMVFGSGGAVDGIYDKIHLVPFGEYLPFKSILEKIGLEQLARQRGGFGIGPHPRPNLKVPGLPLVGPLICYEAIFPATVVQGLGPRPGVFVNVTNDGWFGNTTGPRQHLHQARVRAVEEGLPLVRAANNGISGVVAPSGRITAFLALNEKGSIDADLPQAISPPFYARLGDWIFFLLLSLAAACFCYARADRRR